jgi:hypothetical protein
MGESRGAPGFGQVDLDIEDDLNGAASPGAASTKPPSGFGELDFDLGEPGDAEPEPPPSRSRVFGPEKARTANTRATVRKHDPIHDESTRIVSGDALSHITRPPPALEPQDVEQQDDSTRAWAEVDEALLTAGQEEEQDAPPSSRSGAQPAPSASGVASHGGRVAAMRELYARGDADGALALASSLGESLAPAGVDHPDASIVVEFGEQSIDLSDPFGGLIPIDDELAAMPTAAPPQYVPTAPPPGPVAQLTLTERQSIPRVLKSMGEVAKLKIDHRAGFLLAHVDGMQTLEEILDICAMPPAEALALIANLKTMGVIEFE